MWVDHMVSRHSIQALVFFFLLTTNAIAQVKGHDGDNCALISRAIEHSKKYLDEKSVLKKDNSEELHLIMETLRLKKLIKLFKQKCD